MDTRPQAHGGWELVRGAVGVGFLSAAAFNALLTYRRPEVFLGPARKAAWLPPWRWFLERVMTPHPRPVIVAVVAYEATVGILILGRGRQVRRGIGGAMLWAAVTTPILPPAQAIGNAAIAPAIAPLLSRSYRRTSLAVWRRRNSLL